MYVCQWFTDTSIVWPYYCLPTCFRPCGHKTGHNNPTACHSFHCPSWFAGVTAGSRFAYCSRTKRSPTKRLDAPTITERVGLPTVTTANGATPAASFRQVEAHPESRIEPSGTAISTGVCIIHLLRFLMVAHSLQGFLRTLKTTDFLAETRQFLLKIHLL